MTVRVISPTGVVQEDLPVRGVPNTASGLFSHVEGGGGSTDVNVAQGESSHAEGIGTSVTGLGAHGEGRYTASAAQYTHAEGFYSTASAQAAHAEGFLTTASGQFAHAEGSTTTASGTVANASGLYAQATRYAQRAYSSGKFATNGDLQVTEMVLWGVTSDQFVHELTTGGAISATFGVNGNCLQLDLNRSHKYTLDIVARNYNVNGTQVGAIHIEGLMSRGSIGTDGRLVGNPSVVSWSDSGFAPVVDVSVQTSLTNQYLRVQVTGVAATTIRWVCYAVMTELSA